MASMLGVPPERVNERCNAGWYSTKLHFDKTSSGDNSSNFQEYGLFFWITWKIDICTTMNKFWFSHKTNSQIQDFWADFATDSVRWFRKFHRTKSCQNASLCIAQEIRYRRHEVWLIQLTKTLNFTRLELCTYNLCTMLYVH